MLRQEQQACNNKTRTYRGQRHLGLHSHKLLGSVKHAGRVAVFYMIELWLVTETRWPGVLVVLSDVHSFSTFVTEPRGGKESKRVWGALLLSAGPRMNSRGLWRRGHGCGWIARLKTGFQVHTSRE